MFPCLVGVVLAFLPASRADLAAVAAVAEPTSALAAKLGFQTVISSGSYSRNFACRERNCINPIFPGLMELPKLENQTWQCQLVSEARPLMYFCGDFVDYNFVAVPSPTGTLPLEELVRTQEEAAVTTYFYHLSAMKYDVWQLQSAVGEVEEDGCTKAVRKLVCGTYFPRAEAGCQKGEQTRYLRPCKNVCHNYLSACNVECCDESTKCVFEHKVSFLEGGEVQQRSGYVDALGPSAICTGAAGRSLPMPLLWLLAALGAAQWSTGTAGPPSALPFAGRRGMLGVSLAVAAVSLQGCELNSKTSSLLGAGHSTANWEAKPNYLDTFSVIPEGQPASKAALNSCGYGDIHPEANMQVCGGHGFCKVFNASTNMRRPLMMCQCNLYWADPECRTPRKSQAAAYLLSVVGGPLGLDHFYLGDWLTGVLKLSTLGGLGAWWYYDIVRVGASPVYANNYRLAPDLPHPLFVLITVLIAVGVGHAIFGVYAASLRRQRRMAKLLLKAEDEFVETRSASALQRRPGDMIGMPIVVAHREPIAIERGIPSHYGAMQQARAALSQATPPMSRFPQPAVPHSFSGHVGRVPSGVPAALEPLSQDYASLAGLAAAAPGSAVQVPATESVADIAAAIDTASARSAARSATRSAMMPP
eukprot:TRINITY_DN49402_c0_g1_i1.p1 TRINITY_DN49402_c0_g1~~TRINITY_DN49402_c0_g1_i1.p1  ORF type:complete len:645 (-),score=125.86 TRINITY_DN49402_c0_g1_i1:137-2071(-)